MTCSTASSKPLWREVIARPTWLGATSGPAILWMYAMSRISSPDTALNLLGSWLQTHTQVEPQFSSADQATADSCYLNLGFGLALQYRPHLTPVEQNYLPLADGGCCLPAAYGLAHAYRCLGRAEEWIAKLDARLQDKTIQGDPRVGWLLARAWAEEFRSAGAGEGGPLRHVLAGRSWLDEACLTAQSEPVKLRAYKELLVRLTQEEQFDAARDLLKKATGQCSLPDSATKLAQWGQQIDALAQSSAQSHAQQVTDSQKAYWDAIRARRQKALDAGDKAAVSRYEKMMSDAGITP